MVKDAPQYHYRLFITFMARARQYLFMVYSFGKWKSWTVNRNNRPEHTVKYIVFAEGWLGQF
jgi:hypothetical protein